MADVELDTLFVDITNKEEEREPILMQYEFTIFSRGAMSLITGKAKSRKTFFISAIVAALVQKKEILSFKNTTNCRVMWIDTEQSIFHFHKALLRAYQMANMPTAINSDSIIPYSFATLSTEERIQKLKEAIDENKPDVVIIDGIRDFVLDINDIKESSKLKDLLMWLYHQYDCHICSVLHQNKGDNNARGHLGTELTNKSETVISLDANNGITKVLPVCCRNVAFDPLAFVIDDETGLPKLYGGNLRITKREKWLVPVLEEIYKDGKPKKWKELMDAIQTIAKVSRPTALVNIKYSKETGLLIYSNEYYRLNLQ